MWRGDNPAVQELSVHAAVYAYLNQRYPLKEKCYNKVESYNIIAWANDRCFKSEYDVYIYIML